MQGVSGSVCEVPQTRKTTKICTDFLIFRYNRDLYTNGYLLPDLILPISWTSQKTSRKMTSRKNYATVSDILHTQGGRYYLETSPRSPKPPRKRAGRELARRGVVFLKNLKPACWSQCEPDHVPMCRNACILEIQLTVNY